MVSVTPRLWGHHLSEVVIRKVQFGQQPALSSLIAPRDADIIAVLLYRRSGQCPGLKEGTHKYNKQSDESDGHLVQQNSTHEMRSIGASALEPSARMQELGPLKLEESRIACRVNTVKYRYGTAKRHCFTHSRLVAPFPSCVIASATFCRASAPATFASSSSDSFLASCTWLAYTQRSNERKGVWEWECESVGKSECEGWNSWGETVKKSVREWGVVIVC
jgi:hypothetical protein